MQPGRMRQTRRHAPFGFSLRAAQAGGQAVRGGMQAMPAGNRSRALRGRIRPLTVSVTMLTHLQGCVLALPVVHCR